MQERSDLQRLVDVADDMGDIIALQDRAMKRLNAEISELRARAHGQAELPLPGTPAAAPAAGHGISRAAILGTLDDLDDAIDRRDADRAKRCVWSLRSAVGEIHSLI